MNRTLDAWQIQADKFTEFGKNLKREIFTEANMTLEEKLPKLESFVNKTLDGAAGFWKALAIAMREAASTTSELLTAAGKKDLGSDLDSTMMAAVHKVTSFVDELQAGVDRCAGLTEKNAPAKLGELNATLETLYLKTDDFVSLVNDSIGNIVHVVRRTIWEESLLQQVDNHASLLAAAATKAKSPLPDMGAAFASVQQRAVGIAGQMGDAMHYMVFRVERTMTDLGIPILQSGASRSRSFAVALAVISLLISKS